MYKRILVPLDGSPSSEAVFPHIQALAHAFGADIILLQILLEPTEEFSIPTSALAPPKRVKRLQMKARTYLNAVCSKLEKEGLRASYLIRQGGIAEMILQVAGFMDVDLIAMTTQGRSAAQILLLGSVTYQVVRHSPLPMMVIRT